MARRKNTHTPYNPISDADLMVLKLMYSGDEAEAYSLLEIALRHDPYIVGRAIKAAKPKDAGDRRAWDHVLVALKVHGWDKYNDTTVDAKLGWYVEWFELHYPEYHLEYSEYVTVFDLGEDNEREDTCRFTGVRVLDLT